MLQATLLGVKVFHPFVLSLVPLSHRLPVHQFVRPCLQPPFVSYMFLSVDILNFPAYDKNQILPTWRISPQLTALSFVLSFQNTPCLYFAYSHVVVANRRSLLVLSKGPPGTVLWVLEGHQQGFFSVLPLPRERAVCGGFFTQMSN